VILHRNDEDVLERAGTGRSGERRRGQQAERKATRDHRLISLSWLIEEGNLPIDGDCSVTPFRQFTDESSLSALRASRDEIVACYRSYLDHVGAARTAPLRPLPAGKPQPDLAARQ